MPGVSQCVETNHGQDQKQASKEYKISNITRIDKALKEAVQVGRYGNVLQQSEKA